MKLKSACNQANLRLKVPINMILDEFGNMPPVKDIDAMLTAARSRGIRITLIVQDFGQIDKQYGKDIYLNIVEVRNPDVNAQLVAENIASQLERRIVEQG